MPTITKLYSWKEAAEHASNEDCWVVVDGNVYDVSKYLDEHPGGDDILLKSAGKDVTDEFEDVGHSKSAREIMTDYFIGEIDLSSATIPELEIFKKEQQSPPSLKFLDRPLQFWVLPVALVSVSAVVGLLYLRKK